MKPIYSGDSRAGIPDHEADPQEKQGQQKT
jgi:hypothetical protein